MGAMALHSDEKHVSRMEMPGTPKVNCTRLPEHEIHVLMKMKRAQDVQERFTPEASLVVYAHAATLSPRNAQP